MKDGDMGLREKDYAEMAILAIVVLVILFSGFRCSANIEMKDKTPIECWTMKEPPAGWTAAHISEKHKREVAELHVEPDALLCHRLDKDGLPIGEGELRGQWWRKK